MKTKQIQTGKANILAVDRNNLLAELFIRTTGIESCFLDSSKILWKIVNGQWIGKRSVWTFDFRACWLEDTTIQNVKSWWHTENSDYTEIFKK